MTSAPHPPCVTKKQNRRHDIDDDIVALVPVICPTAAVSAPPPCWMGRGGDGGSLTTQRDTYTTFFSVPMWHIFPILMNLV